MNWQIKYKLGQSSKYYYKVVEAISQNEAHKIFDHSYPALKRIGGATLVRSS